MSKELHILTILSLLNEEMIISEYSLLWNISGIFFSFIFCSIFLLGLGVELGLTLAFELQQELELDMQITSSFEFFILKLFWEFSEY